MIDSIDLLSRLVRINSVNAFYRGGPGEGECAAFVASFWKQNGIECWTEEVLPGRPNVIARVRGADASRALLLEAHMDTVSIEGMSIPPFEPMIQQGRMYGRGACDTKAGLAAMLAATVRVVQEGFIPHCDLWIASVIDEEHSCAGIKHFCERHRPTAAIVAEPTEMRLVIASKGVLRWRIHAQGIAAHSSKVELGKNAIHHMAKLLVAIEEHHRDIENRIHPLLGRSTGNVGLIQGGVQINFVPDRCCIEIDRRTLPDETASEILAGYQEIIDRLVANDPSMNFAIEPPMLEEKCLNTDPCEAIVEHARRALETLRLPSEECGVAYGSDASKLQESGVPSILFGPGSIDQAHTADEFIEIDQVRQAAEFYYRVIKEYS